MFCDFAQNLKNGFVFRGLMDGRDAARGKALESEG